MIFFFYAMIRRRLLQAMEAFFFSFFSLSLPFFFPQHRSVDSNIDSEAIKAVSALRSDAM